MTNSQIDTLNIHPSHFETLALRIAFDLINRRIIPVSLNTPDYDAVVDSIIYTMKHQHHLHQTGHLRWTLMHPRFVVTFRGSIPTSADRMTSMRIEPGQLRIWSDSITSNKTPFLVIDHHPDLMGARCLTQVIWRIMWCGKIIEWSHHVIATFSEVISEEG